MKRSIYEVINNVLERQNKERIARINKISLRNTQKYSEKPVNFIKEIRSLEVDY